MLDKNRPKTAGKEPKTAATYRTIVSCYRVNHVFTMPAPGKPAHRVNAQKTPDMTNRPEVTPRTACTGYTGRTTGTVCTGSTGSTRYPYCTGSTGSSYCPICPRSPKCLLRPSALSAFCPLSAQSTLSALFLQAFCSLLRSFCRLRRTCFSTEAESTPQSWNMDI